jgi:cysteine desulfurase family protein (TIGR01976 family)
VCLHQRCNIVRGCEKLSSSNERNDLGGIEKSIVRRERRAKSEEKMTSTPVVHRETAATIDPAWVRAQFPSLQLRVNGQHAVFFDGPAGTQAPQQVMRAVQDYFLHKNANTCGAFATSRVSDEAIAAARLAMADFFNCHASEVVFGQNMTTITFALARAIGRDLSAGDEIVVTTLDHDANVAPWRALEEQGVVIRQADIREADCTLDLEDLQQKITPKTKLVAVGYASNAVGTINPVGEIAKMAHAAGAMIFIDAVHYAPHGSIDVQALDCDFLACSPYKFFGPHMGALYGKREHLERLRPYKVRPASEQIPDRWETGTQLHELIVGVHAAVDYLAELGRHCDASAVTRREALLAAYRATVPYERSLLTELIAGLLKVPKLKFFGIRDSARFSERCSTVSVRLGDHHPTAIAAFLGERGIFTWDGSFYALNLTERLGVESIGGLLRIGLVHYNTADEVDRLLAALNEFARQ